VARNREFLGPNRENNRWNRETTANWLYRILDESHVYVMFCFHLVGRLPPGKWPGISRPVSTIIPAASSHTAAAVNGTA
jgi:hypothetical protein